MQIVFSENFYKINLPTNDKFLSNLKALTLSFKFKCVKNYCNYIYLRAKQFEPKLLLKVLNQKSRNNLVKFLNGSTPTRFQNPFKVKAGPRANMHSGRYASSVVTKR